MGRFPGYRTRGFTLIEVLVAVTITALLGVGAFTLLSQAIRSKEIVEQRSTLLQAIQRADRVMAADFSQMVERGVRDSYGEPQPPLLAGQGGSLASFTRTGLRSAAILMQSLAESSALAPRSDLQRVGYRLEEGTLIRQYWDVLDQADEDAVREQRLLEGVTELKLRFLTQTNQWTETWPPTVDLSGEFEDLATENQGTDTAPEGEGALPGTTAIARSVSTLPKGVEMLLEHEIFGSLRRVWPIASYRPPAASRPAGNSGSATPQPTGENPAQPAGASRGTVQ